MDGIALERQVWFKRERLNGRMWITRTPLEALRPVVPWSEGYLWKTTLWQRRVAGPVGASPVEASRASLYSPPSSYPNMGDPEEGDQKEKKIRSYR